MKFIFLKV